MAATFDFRDEADETLGDEDKRTLVNFLVEQIEFADVVVLNKVVDAAPLLVGVCRSGSVAGTGEYSHIDDRASARALE